MATGTPTSGDALSFLKELVQTPCSANKGRAFNADTRLPQFDDDLVCQDSPVGRLTSIFYDKKFTDVTIKFTTSGETIQAHKLILSITSSVFEDQFKLDPDLKTLTLDDDPVVFKWIIHHAYTGLTQMPNDIPFVVQLYKMLDKYKMNDAVQGCILIFFENIRLKTIDHIYEIAEFSRDGPLQFVCEQFIRDYCKEIMNKAATGQVSKKVLLRVLQTNVNTGLTELQTFDKVVQWGDNKLTFENQPLNGKTLREMINDCLPLISFESITPQEIIQTVVPQEIFTNEEIMEILNKKSRASNQLSISHVRRRRILLDEERINFCQLEKRRACKNGQTWLSNGEQLIAKIQTSRDILLSKVNVFKQCFPGGSTLTVLKNDRRIGQVSLLGPPWKFKEPVELKKDITYFVKIRGHGKATKHDFHMFTKVVNEFLEIAGECVSCELAIQYYD